MGSRKKRRPTCNGPDRGCATAGNITPRESEQTSARCLNARRAGQAPKEAEQMTGAHVPHRRTRSGGAPGAAPQRRHGWNQIDWERAEREVKRLQQRIAKATMAGRWGKVRALQHLLTRSFFGKALAVRRVTTNRGSKTPGVDQVLWKTPTHKYQAIHLLRARGYQPQPLRRVYIDKRDKKAKRPLG